MRVFCLCALIACTFAAPVHAKKRAPASAGVASRDYVSLDQIADPDQRTAIAKLMSRYRWGMSSETVLGLLAADITETYNERIANERSPFKQDTIRRELGSALERLREEYVTFDGQKTGWDVSLIDHQFTHNNNESMMVIKEPSGQQRFMFFYKDKLWKQFITFNNDQPPFAGKSFDEFTALLEQRFGTGSMAFRPQLAREELAVDHLEWAVSPDYGLWAIDLSTLYNNYVLVVLQASLVEEIEKTRKAHGSDSGGSTLVDAVTQSRSSKKDDNSNVVDQITGQEAAVLKEEEPVAPPPKKKKGK